MAYTSLSLHQSLTSEVRFTDEQYYQRFIINAIPIWQSMTPTSNWMIYGSNCYDTGNKVYIQTYVA